MDLGRAGRPKSSELIAELRKPFCFPDLILNLVMGTAFAAAVFVGAWARSFTISCSVLSRHRPLYSSSHSSQLSPLHPGHKIPRGLRVRLDEIHPHLR